MANLWQLAVRPFCDHLRTEFRRVPDSCEVQWWCRRCGHVSHGIEHVDVDWHGDCTDARRGGTCRRCGEPVARRGPHHDFGPAAYVRDGDCTRVKTCAACGFEKPDKVHTYGAWVRESPCVERTTCSRCGLSVPRVEHAFGRWQPCEGDESHEERICKHDGERQVRSVPVSDPDLEEEILNEYRYRYW